MSFKEWSQAQDAHLKLGATDKPKSAPAPAEPAAKPGEAAAKPDPMPAAKP